MRNAILIRRARFCRGKNAAITIMFHRAFIPRSSRSSGQTGGLAAAARGALCMMLQTVKLRAVVDNGRLRRISSPAWHLLIAALLVSLAACEVGPDFTRPAAPLAGNWLESGDASVHTDRQDDEKWWTAFKDPTLDRLIDLAYRQNLTLLA